MAKFPELAILDVGHGNTAVLTDADGVMVFDAALGGTLLDYLEHAGVTEIDAVFVSHADADHIGGVISLLVNPNITVHDVYLNSDAIKDTATWMDFRHAIPVARERGTIFHLELTAQSPGSFKRGQLKIEVLAPTQEVVASGPGGTDLEGRPLTSNSCSVVMRIIVGDVPVVLLAADLDGVGLLNLLESIPSPKVAILIFPHHGGLPSGAEPTQFARDLCNAVEPASIVFSIGRGRYGTPRPEIIAGIRSLLPHAYIACTQLSETCAAKLPVTQSLHLSGSPARGMRMNSCCAGTIHVRLDQGRIVRPAQADHTAFILREAPQALCRQSFT